MKSNLILFAVVLIFIPGCGSEDLLKGSFTVTINGEEKEAEDPLGSLEFFESLGHEGRVFEVGGLLDDDSYITVAVTNWDFQFPPTNGVLEKSYYNSISPGTGRDASDCIAEGGNYFCDLGLVYFVIDGDSYTSQLDGNSHVEITSIKTESKKISGNFNAIVSGPSGDIQVFGTFKDVDYFIQ